MKNIVAFSLYGDLPLYCEGAKANIALVKVHYPGWTCRFYVDHTVPGDVVGQLAAAGAEIVTVNKPSLGPMYGRYWRFWVAADPTVGRFIIRDVDSRLNSRERAAVDAWIASGRRFHIMRDGPWYRSWVASGMWGGIGGSFPHMAELIDAWGLFSEWGQNDRFASEVLFPLMEGDYLCHNDMAPFDDGEPFPPHAPLDGTFYVGEVVRPGGAVDIWLECGNALKKFHAAAGLGEEGWERSKRETERANHEAERANREAERANREAERADREALRAEVEAVSAAALREEVDALRRALEEQRAATEGLHREVAAWEERLRSVLSSRIWRLTAPLRRIGGLVLRRR